MPLYIKDYLGDTMHLTPEAHGIYLLLIIHYWINTGPIQDNVRSLLNVTRTDNEKLLKEILSEFFTLSNGLWSHKRIDKELASSISRREASQINGKKGGRPPRNNNLEETYRLNLGKPRNNLTPNLEKSSSSSSSSSSLQSSIQAQSEEKRTRKRFQKPTIDELKDYALSISFPDFDAERFIDYYESNGWKVGKNPMVDWQSTVRGWKKNGSTPNKGSKPVYKHGGDINFEL